MFWAYSFPLMSIAISGIFDAIARIESKSPKNPKLAIRIVVDSIAVLLTALIGGHGDIFSRLIPAIMLGIAGLSLIYEIIMNVVTAIKVSKWAAGE